MSSPEQYTGGAERGHEVEKAAAERAAELREQHRENGERPDPNAAEREVTEARMEAEKQAKTAEDYHPSAETEKSPAFSGATTREKSYKQTMKSIQREMSAPERAFSKVIHNKAVEKASDVVGASVARPNAILSGAVCAFLLVGSLYLLARQNGFALQGSETIAAFVLGWLLGVAFDFLRVMISGKR